MTIEAWQTACLAGFLAGICSTAAALLCFVLHRCIRYRKNLRQSGRYSAASPSSPPKPVRAAWMVPGENDDHHERHSRHEIMVRQLCDAPCQDADVVRPIETSDGYSMELDPVSTSSRKANLWWQSSGQHSRPSDSSPSYACPPPSPGSRHAFANRCVGPRQTSARGFGHMSSPGCISDHTSPYRSPLRPALQTDSGVPRSLPHHCQTRYLGDSDCGWESTGSSPTRNGLSYSFSAVFPDEFSPLRCSPHTRPSSPTLLASIREANLPGGLAGQPANLPVLDGISCLDTSTALMEQEQVATARPRESLTDTRIETSMGDDYSLGANDNARRTLKFVSGLLETKEIASSQM